MKPIMPGIIFVAMPIAILLLYSSFMIDKLLWVPVKVNESTSALLVIYPIVQEDGTIECENGCGLEFGTFVLSQDQVANYNEIGSINEPSYYFERIGTGSLVINNDNDGIKIKINLPPMGMFVRNYSGEYKLTGNKLILLNASYKFFHPIKFLLFYGLIFLSAFIGLVFIISCIIKKYLVKK
jgi:hypothetical protein